MTLYNIRSDGDEFRITKFTNELDVESSYLTSHTECQCPAGSRPTCRHRQMLPTMLAAGLLDTGGFYDFESQQVLLPVAEESDALGNGEEYIDNPIVNDNLAAATDLPMDDITILNIDNPEQMHNALADALGEPRRPSFVEGTVGITPEELAAELPTYEEAISNGYTEMTAPDAQPIDTPHPTIGKIDRRI